MVELDVEHVLLFVVAAFLLYRLMGSCGCSYDNGFSVGINDKYTDIDEGKCCSMGQCKDGLECNWQVPGGEHCQSLKVDIPYWGICSKPTHWFGDVVDTVAGWDWSLHNK
jgi:hypothetical protein